MISSIFQPFQPSTAKKTQALDFLSKSKTNKIYIGIFLPYIYSFSNSPNSPSLNY